MKFIGYTSFKAPEGVDRPPMGKLVPWWNGSKFLAARRVVWNQYALYDVEAYEVSDAEGKAKLEGLAGCI